MHTRGSWAAPLLALAVVVTGCSSADDERVPTLNWHTPPDRVDAAALAATCSADSGGAYRIEVTELPADVGERRVEIVRRLRAGDDGIDILGVDTALTAELAAGGLLAPVPDGLSDDFADGLFEAAEAASTYDDELVTVPWWYDPHLLWFRGNSAERAGLDTTAPVAWEDLIAGAQRIGGTVQIAGSGGSGTAAWVNALVVGAEGSIVDGRGRTPTFGLDTAAGQRAASIVGAYSAAGVGDGPSEEAARAFASLGGAFLVAPSSVISDPALAPIRTELNWTSYPVVDEVPAAPLAGVGLGVPRDAPQPSLAYEAIACLTSPELQAELMTSSGHSAARETTYDEEAVVDDYPLADVVLDALQAGATEPVTPYWSRVRDGIDATWLPLSGVDADTPAASQVVIRDLVLGGLR